MIDLTWRLFSQTGNIETYLLLKELEEMQPNARKSLKKQDNEQVSSFDTNM